MADCGRVVTEIERILTAPYPTSLSNLNAILEHATGADITLWAKSKPCQVAPLLDVLASRIQNEPTAFSALARLLKSHATFEVFRHQHLSLLDGVYLGQLQSENALPHVADGSGTDSATYSQTFTSILHVLPPNAGVPSSYPGYLEHAIQGNDTETLGQWQERVYDFLAGAPLDLLSSLCEPVVRLCVQRWAALMRSANCAESLYAAYVACKLRRHAEALRHTDSSMGSYPPVCGTLKAWIEKCYAIFQGSQSIETVRNTLIRVLKLTCDEKCRGLANADTAVALAGDVLAVSQKQYSGDWAKDTGAYARKIVQKYDAMSPHLKVASVHVLAVLDARSWSSEATEMFRKALQHLTASEIALGTSSYPQSGSADALICAADHCMALTSMDQATHVFASFVKELYGFIIEQCRPNRATTMAKLAGVEQALHFVEALQATERNAPSMITSMFLQAAEAMGVPEWWALDMMTPGTPENCCDLSSCVHADELKRQKVCNQVSLLLITSGCGSARQLPRSIVEALGQRLAEGCLDDDQSSCIYRPFVQSQHLPATRQPPQLNSHNWQEYLEEHLRSSNAVSCEFTKAVINTVCEDLQDRCDRVEVPLRAAQAEIERLTNVIQQQQNEAAVTTSETNKLQETLRVAQEARTHDSACAAKLQSSLDVLQQQLKDARQQIDTMVSEKAQSDLRAKQELEEAQQKAEEEIETMQRQHATQITELEAQLSSQNQANSILENESAWLKEQTELARNELVAAHMREIENLNQQHETTMDQLKEQIAELRDAASSSSSEIERLSTDLHEREQSIEQLVQERDESQNQVSALKTDLQSANADNSILTADLAVAHSTNTDLENKLSSKAAELEQRDERINELEAIELRWKQRCGALEKTVADARQREESISALLGGRASSAGLPSRRSTFAAIPNPSANRETPARRNHAAAAPRLPGGSFMSEEDDDENYYEIMKLAQ